VGRIVFGKNAEQTNGSGWILFSKILQHTNLLILQ